jgi:hypothetical protein
MKRLSLGLIVVLLAIVQAPALPGAWGRVFAVEVRGDSLAEPLTITDPAIVQELSFWVGPGTNFSEFMGPVNREGSIVDWGRGEATDRPGGLERFDVRFLLEPRDNPPVYLVLYEPDPRNDRGYIFYPAKGGSSIVTHFVEDTWRYASVRWNERVGAAILEQKIAARKSDR